MSLWLVLYRGVGRLAGPALALHLRRRVRQGKEDEARLGERFGRYPNPRPAGTLLWFHAASVGESLAILPVLETVLDRHPSFHALLTTGTLTSAQLMAERLPSGASHAFVPFDTPKAVERFMQHWRPDASVFVEQELWPNLLIAAPTPRVLVNARFSHRTARRWRRMPSVIRWLVHRFDPILAQSTGDAERLLAAGAPCVLDIANLKEAAAPLPVDPEALAALEAAIGDRPVWVAASTHAPEEEAILAVAAAVRKRVPDLLLVIVPRHPDRGDEIAELMADERFVQRSKGQMPDASTTVFLADSLGELGLFYRLADLAFVGGSLLPHGGQNPLEPARLGVPVLFGPHMFNFQDVAARLLAVGAAEQVADAAALGAGVEALLTEPDRLAAMRERALGAYRHSPAVQDTADAILQAMGR